LAPKEEKADKEVADEDDSWSFGASNDDGDDLDFSAFDSRAPLDVFFKFFLF
jgi:hypothetical protein